MTPAFEKYECSGNRCIRKRPADFSVGLCAVGESRTHTPQRALPPQSSVSTISPLPQLCRPCKVLGLQRYCDLFNSQTFSAFFLIPSYNGQKICAFFRIAESLALVAGEFHAVVPLPEFRDAAHGEFHDDVHRLAVQYVAGKECTDSV